nr:hypothetical protein Iba_chr04dCG9580 [Ipomoea batatas]
MREGRHCGHLRHRWFLALESTRKLPLSPFSLRIPIPIPINARNAGTAMDEDEVYGFLGDLVTYRALLGIWNSGQNLQKWSKLIQLLPTSTDCW